MRRVAATKLGLLVVAATAAAATVVVDTHASAAHAAGPGSDARAAAVARFLGSDVHMAWRAVAGPEGPKWMGVAAGVALVQVDQVGGDVDEVVFTDRLSREKPGGNRIGATRAAAAAHDFLRRHHVSIAGMVLRAETPADHGAFVEYRLVFARRTDEAWLPQSVTVGVGASTGAVLYLSTRSVPVHVATVAAIGSSQATATAVGVLPGGAAAWRAATAPELEVAVLASGAQRLVWSIEYEREHASGPHVPEWCLVRVDAQTSAASVEASS